MDVFREVLAVFCQVLSVIIFLRAILSWFSSRPNSLTLLLDRFTEPFLAPLRRIIPDTGAVDFTPMVAIIILQLLAYVLS